VEEVVVEAMSGVRRALKEARRTIAMMVERGDYGAAIEALAATVDRAFSRLGEALRPLVKSTANLERSIRELRERTIELERGARELRWSLEKEVELRRRLEGRVGHLEGDVSHMRLGGNLIRWCDKYGLVFEWLPRDPFRVDAVVTGKHVIALVEIATTGDEADVGQLLEGVKIYERERGEKPNALVLYIGVRPSSELVEECKEYGIILDNSPKRIVRRLVELDKLGQRDRAGAEGT